MGPVKIFDPLAQPPPVAEEAEKAAIATSMQHEDRAREYMAILRPEHFALERNRTLWEIMRSLHERDLPIILPAIVDEMAKSPAVAARAGGFGYLAEFSVPIGSYRVDMWVRPILDAFARRRLMTKCNESLARLADRSESPSLICQELEEEARDCAALAEPSLGISTFEEIVRRHGGMDAYLAGDRQMAIPYPWPSLTRMTNGGMKPGQVIVIAGPSGRGKTSLALNIAMNGRLTGRPVIFSLEMQGKEMWDKVLALGSRVDSYRFPYLNADEMQMVRRGREFIEPVMIDECEAVTIPAIKAKIRKLMSRHPVSLAVIDYIQLIETKRTSGDNREQEISKIMRSVKRMAMELGIPVIALSQILEDAGAKSREPQLKDLRESRAIGHTANLVLFLHFTRFYDMAQGIPTGELDLIIGKQRSGPEGRVKLVFHAPTGRFYESEAAA